VEITGAAEVVSAGSTATAFCSGNARFCAQDASIVSTAFPLQACTKRKEETILAKTALLDLLVLAR
jgi:hypothetical protein